MFPNVHSSEDRNRTCFYLQTRTVWPAPALMVWSIIFDLFGFTYWGLLLQRWKNIRKTIKFDIFNENLNESIEKLNEVNKTFINSPSAL